MNPLSRLMSALLALGLLAAATPAAAQASDESVERLLAITQAEQLADQVLGQLEQSIRQGLAAATQGRTLSPAQAQVIERAPARLASALREELAWSAMKPIHLAVYKESFSQEEVDGLIAFYQTPLGQATIRKLPLVMQRTSALTQARVQSLVPRLQAAMQQTLAEAGLPAN